MTLIKDLESAFTSHAHQKIAEWQYAYMKGISPFLGLQKPVRAKLQTGVFKLHPVTTRAELVSQVQALWDKPEREYQYAALDLLLLHKKLWAPELLPFFEQLITTKSWWDTVDTLAPHGVGWLVKKHPELVTHVDTWLTDASMWKRRAAVLHQLRYKHTTDTQRLSHYCKKLMHEREFFIAKAIGWSLREYSKTNPTWVRAFLHEHQRSLAPLSVREGGKYC